jgi:hypothetical protein
LEETPHVIIVIITNIAKIFKMKMKEKHNVHIIHQQKEVRHAIFVQMTNLLMLIIQIVLNVLRIVLNVNILNKMKNV